MQMGCDMNESQLTKAVQIADGLRGALETHAQLVRRAHDLRAKGGVVEAAQAYDAMKSDYGRRPLVCFEVPASQVLAATLRVTKELDEAIRAELQQVIAYLDANDGAVREDAGDNNA
jgi:hypothetical protein